MEALSRFESLFKKKKKTFNGWYVVTTFGYVVWPQKTMNIKLFLQVFILL